ncbi:putative E3 ubiquitin-protein ligase RHY1A [Canna indica]|uniref:E3 ubiquitin-protein ligase RHY1A n=1 Tax=Canna indica TaxID=4628 RepID=A0AAQ3Q7V3_9LILI|nr:putative E3 ubiquitin-protein ligase RHY1A [Canna indica]
MTIASKLLYCRRTTSRPSSRISEQDLDLLDADRDASRHGRRSSHEERSGRSQRRPDGRSRSSNHLVHHRAARSESFGPNKSTIEFGEGNSRIGSQVSTGVLKTLRLAGDKLDDRLPHSVLEARTRLQERLRSFHLTESRQDILAPSTSIYDYSYGCIHLKPASACKLLESGDQVVETTHQTDQELCFHNADKKPCVLGYNVEKEIFVNSESDGTPKGFLECSICLEKFLEGERVIRLQCGHRYHHACLEPWMQAHGLCPYCRASVVG